MIALDTSSLVAYLSGAKGVDVDAVEIALQHKHAFLPPVVLSELLSDPKVPPAVLRLFKEIPLLVIMDGYWERVGLIRSQLISRGYKARLADALIAQSCIDHDIPLITRDSDFRHFTKLCGLKFFI